MTLFRPSLPEEEVESTTVPAEERQEREEIVEKRAPEVPEGMVLAEDLPSAANALEQLFSEDAPPAPAGVNGSAVGAAPTAVESDTKPANETHAPPPQPPMLKPPSP